MHFFAGEEQGSEHDAAIYYEQFKAKLVTIEELLREVTQQERYKGRKDGQNGNQLIADLQLCKETEGIESQ